MRQQFNGNKIAVYSDAEHSFAPVDAFVSKRKKNIEADKEKLVIRPGTFVGIDGGSTTRLDFPTWLPFAAKQYEISPNISDYIFVPVITIPSDIPNRNGVAFPLRELVKFNVEQGMQAYRTFRGKPVHVEHKNDIPKEARGVIVDSYLRKLDGYGGGKVWKLVELLAIDRTKDPMIASRILSGDLNTYSMGSWVNGGYTCSICGAELGKCVHLNPRNQFDFTEFDGQLAFRNVHDITGFETSIVETPAYISALSDTLMSF